jgi:hypothetical protein
MTAASTSRRARLLGSTAQVERPPMILTMAQSLVALALADPTVSGGTVFMPDGGCRYISISDARAMVGTGPAAGSA